MSWSAQLPLGALISPGLFYAGAASVAAPIIIHLLARRRFKRIRWAAVAFLLEAQRRNRRRIQLHEIIILLLRCLAILLLGLLVSRPFLQPQGLASVFGGSSRAERVIVVDDSYSMGYTTGTETSFDRAKAAVRRIVSRVRQEAPQDTITLMRMTDVGAPVEVSVFLDDVQTEQLLSRLEGLTVSQRTVDPASVFEQLADTLSQDVDTLNASVYLISDFQRVDWASRSGRSADGANKSGLADTLAAWGKEERGLDITFVQVGPDAPVNYAITGLSSGQRQIVAGAPAILSAKVANFGDATLTQVDLAINVGGFPQPDETIENIQAQQEANVDIETEFLRVGSEVVKVQLPPDALPVDNTRYLAVDVASAIRILVVNGEPSADEFLDEVSFLTTALRPEGDLFSGIDVKVIEESAVESTDLSDYHAVVLANVYRLSEPGVDALERFAQRGGGVMFFLGDQVDAELYNSSFYSDGQGLLPAKLLERSRTAKASHLSVTDRLHPAMQGFGREGDPLGLGQIPFFEFFKTQLPDVQADATDAADVADTAYEAASKATELGLVGRDATNVIAQFDDPDQSPAILEKKFGRGRVLLITTSADKEWHQWPNHPTYLPVLMELVGYVARSTKDATDIWVGNAIKMAIDPSRDEPDVLVRTPGYPEESEITVTATPDAHGQGLVAVWDRTDEAGVYEFVTKRRDGSTMSQRVAVNLDPRESDLSRAEEAELKQAMGSVAFHYIESLDQLSGEGGESRTELWRTVLLMVMAVLMIEQLLAWRWGQVR